MIKERLQKIIANRGYCSRRRAETLILNNQVFVDGKLVNTLGEKFLLDVEIKINDINVTDTDKVYLMLYKPKGCVTTTYDPQGRKTVLNYLTDIKVRIYPIGRLDYNTSGLLLLTNDGIFANKIIHPTSSINKVYVAEIDNIINSQLIKQLIKGVIIDKDFLAKAIKVKILEHKPQTLMYTLEIAIQDGHNQQVRKMIGAIGGRVISLKRVAIGSLSLGKLARGEYRALTIKEREKLLSLVKKNST